MSHINHHEGINTNLPMNHDHGAEKSVLANTNGQNLKDMMMAMTFHGGYQGQILFDQWNPMSVGAFVASWFAVFLLAVFYEALKTLRDMLARRDICPSCNQADTRQQSLAQSDEQPYERRSENALLSPNRTEIHYTNRARLLSFPHAIQSLLHIIQMALSYLLMLVAMTYNTYLFFAIVLGAGLGHFLFAWRRSTVIDHNEHCH